MLIKCPECNLQISDKAISCPHCGFPLAPQKCPNRKRSSRSSGHMKLPNGFGSISKRNNSRLRKPYYARVCVGKTPDNKPILKPLKPNSSFETYNDAYNALVEYHKNPYDLEPDITLKQLYDKWTESYFPTTKESYHRTISASWAYCSSVYNMRVKDIKVRHIKGVMENGYIIVKAGKEKGQKRFPSPGVKARIKSMFNLMFDYAMEYEIVTSNPARAFDISGELIKEAEKNRVDHIIFTDHELSVLWDNVGKVQFVDWILIQCYMGWRPQEMALLELHDVDLKNGFIRGGIKTDSGKQRVVPIHHRIYELVRKNYNFAVELGSDRLFNDPSAVKGGIKMTYDKYANRFNRVIEILQLNSQHRAHDPRKTFVTAAKKAGINDNAIKKMAGHKIYDITESAYTQRDIDWLKRDIEKIP